jgi:hypothetical protein
MAACAGAHRDQAIGAFLERLLGEEGVDHVVQNDAAIGMDRVIHVRRAPSEVMTTGTLNFTQASMSCSRRVVGLVDDLVDGIGRRRRFGMRLIPGGQFVFDPVQPIVQQRLRARVQRRESADNAALALLDYQFRVGDDELRRADGRQAQFVEQRRQGHASLQVASRLQSGEKRVDA